MQFSKYFITKYSSLYKFREDELMAKFTQFMYSLQLVIHSVDFAWDYRNPCLSAKTDQSLYNTRVNLIDNALTPIYSNQYLLIKIDVFLGKSLQSLLGHYNITRLE